MTMYDVAWRRSEICYTQTQTLTESQIQNGLYSEVVLAKKCEEEPEKEDIIATLMKKCNLTEDDDFEGQKNYFYTMKEMLGWIFYVFHSDGGRTIYICEIMVGIWFFRYGT